MARRRAAAGPARGGETVQAPRPTRTRVVAAAAATLCALALAGYAASRSGAWSGVSAFAGATAALALCAAVFLRLPPAVPWPLFALGALYTPTLRGGLDGWSVAFGAGLLLTAELAYWGIDDERLVLEERVVTLRRAAAVAAVVAASLLAGLVVLVVAGASVSAGLPLTAVGTAAAVGLLLGFARLAR